MAATAAEGERTKYKAIVRHAHETIMRGVGKDPEATPLSSEKVGAIAKILEINALTPTRPDRRFPNTNQANNCWTAFNEYQLCVEKRGKRDPLCLQRGRDYSTVCPMKWVEGYKDQAERGVSMSVGKAFISDKE